MSILFPYTRRCLSDAEPGGSGLERVRFCIVEQQELTDLLPERVVGKQRAHGKSVANPMTLVGAVTAENGLGHRKSPRRPVERISAAVAAKIGVRPEIGSAHV